MQSDSKLWLGFDDHYLINGLKAWAWAWALGLRNVKPGLSPRKAHSMGQAGPGSNRLGRARLSQPSTSLFLVDLNGELTVRSFNIFWTYLPSKFIYFTVPVAQTCGMIDGPGWRSMKWAKPGKSVTCFGHGPDVRFFGPKLGQSQFFLRPLGLD